MKKVILSILVLIAVFTVGCQKQIPYEEIPFKELPESIKPEGGYELGTGIVEEQGTTYAFIMASKGTEINIISVEKSTNFGIDITYRLMHHPSLESSLEVKTIKFDNPSGAPVGFIELDDEA